VEECFAHFNKQGNLAEWYPNFPPLTIVFKFLHVYPTFSLFSSLFFFFSLFRQATFWNLSDDFLRSCGRVKLAFPLYLSTFLTWLLTELDDWLRSKITFTKFHTLSLSWVFILPDQKNFFLLRLTDINYCNWYNCQKLKIFINHKTNQKRRNIKQA